MFFLMPFTSCIYALHSARACHRHRFLPSTRDAPHSGRYNESANEGYTRPTPLLLDNPSCKSTCSAAVGAVHLWHLIWCAPLPIASPYFELTASRTSPSRTTSWTYDESARLIISPPPHD